MFKIKNKIKNYKLLYQRRKEIFIFSFNLFKKKN